MNRDTLVKNISQIVAVPVAICAIALPFQKPAEAAQAFESSITPSPTVPSELISRYATYSFRVTNSQSTPIYYLHVSPSNVNSWEEDILGSSIISAGESTQVSIDDNRASCMYDFKAVFKDDSVSTAYNVDVCDLSSYTF